MQKFFLNGINSNMSDNSSIVIVLLFKCQNEVFTCALKLKILDTI